MNYHNEIMNLPCVLSMLDLSGPLDRNVAFKVGHRTARHQAAEICNQADARIEELESALQSMIDSYEYEASAENPSLLQAKKVLAQS